MPKNTIYGGSGQWSRGKYKKEDDDEEEAEQEERLEATQAKPEDIEKPPGIENFGPSPLFGALVALLDNFAQSQPKGAKLKDKYGMLARFYDMYRHNVGPDLYPVIRLLLPDRDNRRRTYALKEAKLAAALVKALNLGKDSENAKRLLNWKTPLNDGDGAGEFSTVAYGVFKQTVATTAGTMTFDDVNSALDDLSRVGRGSRRTSGVKYEPGEEHARILRRCVHNMTAGELKWFVRIILRDLKVGASERTILGAMHPDAMETFNSCSDILRVCWKLHDQDYRCPREDKLVRLGSAFLPMLCYRNMRDLGSIVKFMKSRRNPAPDPDPDNPWYCTDDEFLVEEKLDGERLCLHKRGNEYFYFSRTSKDYTQQYGPNASSGSLTPFIRDCIVPEIENVILDGEVLVWDPLIQKYLPFGQLKSYFNQTDYDNSSRRPCYKVFDVIYAKGPQGEQHFLETPLFKRKLFLSQILKPKPGVLELAETTKASTKQDLSRTLATILEARGEGLVIKHPLSNYILNGREQTWIKLKPEYVDELAETIEAAVLGGYWGGGHRGGYHASFLLGLRGSREDRKAEVLPVSGRQPIFTSFAKVGSGFNVEAYNWIKTATAGKWRDFDRKSPPYWLVSNGELPDQVINPTDTFIIDVKAAEIVQGMDYGAGFTLRFPRTKMILKDKTWQDAATLQDLFDMRNKQRKNEDVGHDLKPKKRARVTRTADRPGFVSAPLNGVDSLGDLFKDHIFFVYDGRTERKTHLQKIIKQQGGAYVQMIPKVVPGKRRLVVSSDWVEKGGLARKTGIMDVDVVSPAWITDSVARERLMPLAKKYVVHACSDTLASAEYARSVSSGEEDEVDVDVDVETPEPPQVDASPGGVSQNQAQAGVFPDIDWAWGPAAKSVPARTVSFGPDFEQREAFSDDADSGDEDVLGRRSDQDEVDHVYGPAAGDTVNRSLPQDVSEQVGKVALVDDMDENTKAGSQTLVAEDAQTGEAHYDPDKPFGPPLCFYFDTTANAIRNQLMDPREIDSAKAGADDDLRKAAEGLREKGAQITDDLAHPQLTHVIMHLHDHNRFKAILHRTSKPRYRKIVTHDWVLESLAEGDLVDEADYKA